MASRITLLSNASATGSAVTVPTLGDYLCMIDGTFGGTTAALEQRSPDGLSWLAISSASLTAEGSFVVSLGAGMEVRCSLTGGSASGMYASLDRVL